jgi:BirA family biotin operon repressor/biotin-[acetyl-CoA-carboxylase] ligase
MESLQDYVTQLPGREPRISQARFFPEIGSTNVEALRLAKAGAPDGTLIVADHQTQGKGRLGRKWESPAGKGLYFTLSIRPRFKPEHLPLVTLAGGIALGNILKKYELPPLIIKWPNDIWMEKKKVAGILSESAVQGKNVEFVNIGIGINVSQGPEDFSPELRATATSLRGLRPRDWDRAKILSDLLPELFREIDLLAAQGPESLIRRWEADSGMVGRGVIAQVNGQEKTGKVTGLSREGHLIVQQANGEKLTLVDEDVRLV